jgi:hypothetical protein
MLLNYNAWGGPPLPDAPQKQPRTAPRPSKINPGRRDSQGILGKRTGRSMFPPKTACEVRESAYSTRSFAPEMERRRSET